MFNKLNLRPAQRDILSYEQGWMGISAVPGSGKTFTLSALAARILLSERIQPDQEILIVTLVNSAVNNFSQRIAGFLRKENLFPDVGYRVRTLHGLAHDIVRERPDLVGLSDRFQIIDERDANEILTSVTANWLKANPEFIDTYRNPDLNANAIRNLPRDFADLLGDVAVAFIRTAKDQQITPQQLAARVEALPRVPDLLKFGIECYADYQRALAYRSAVDFDDLIRLALMALESDPDFLQRLRYRWPYILEDEAQDSSSLQQDILEKLAGPDGNWVRVGDPNQAIYETFTTASPTHLENFVRLPNVRSHLLPNSGRSTQSIIQLANYLVEWTRGEHPIHEMQDALSATFIQPSPPGDPQPNPEDQPESIYMSCVKYSPEHELDMVLKSVKAWEHDHRDETLAILTPRNDGGAKIVAALRAEGIEPVEMLRSSQSTRQTADLLATILRFLADPTSVQKLAKIYVEFRRKESENKATAPIIQFTQRLLRSLYRIEDYLAPTPLRDWLEELDEESAPAPVRHELEWLRDLVAPWLNAIILPIDQLLLTISQSIFSSPVDLALAHKLALALEIMAQNHSDWALEEFAAELQRIASNERKFLGFADEDTGFDPERYKGKVVVSTLHKSKGLEWDRVYIMSANNYDFPTYRYDDNSYISEKWFVRDHLNLEAETIFLLKELLNGNPAVHHLEEGVAREPARLDYCRERLRLLYVAITRARKALVITSNNGRRGDCTPALPLLTLQKFWSERS